MVSFWPFRGEDANSTKSFEKALAALSDKIQRLQIRDDTLRATHRRVKVLFTLYGSFIYILVFLILTLVTGYEKWHATEWSAIAASPVAILAFRYLVDFYFDWREGNVRTRLEKYTKERDKVIRKFKDATRYDSTKELLDKYGGKEGMLKQQNSAGRKTAKQPQQQIQRTGFAPPPTANIPGRVPPTQNALDARFRSASVGQPSQPKQLPQPLQPSESFAPNAFDDLPRQPASAPAPRSSFLDRMLDMIVGEDESATRNRIVLLCTSCRMVNGQAPPGIRSLVELGRWRCGSCGAWNGIESNKLGADSRGNTAPNSPASPSASFIHHDLDESIHEESSEPHEDEVELHTTTSSKAQSSSS